PRDGCPRAWPRPGTGPGLRTDGGRQEAHRRVLRSWTASGDLRSRGRGGQAPAAADRDGGGALLRTGHHGRRGPGRGQGAPARLRPREALEVALTRNFPVQMPLTTYGVGSVGGSWGQGPSVDPTSCPMTNQRTRSADEGDTSDRSQLGRDQRHR